MTKGIFGGNTDYAHYSVSPHYTGYHADADKVAARAKLKEDRQTLKSAGIKAGQYFQFRVADANAKAAMKIKADNEAARIEKITGVKMDVHEGFFL